MKPAARSNKLARILSWIVVAILVLVPFHAFLTVWLSSAVRHYTILRLWKEFLLVPIVAGALYLLIKDRKLWSKLIRLRLTQLIFAYFILLLVCGFTALALHGVTVKAMFYGLLVDSRFLIFFLSTLIITSKTGLLKEKWLKVLIIPAVLVASFAILQFLVLPYDFLKHFGYNAKTIYPYETINHNIHHLRVASFLRGANPLGAYLILPLSVMVALILKYKNRRSSALVVIFGLSTALLFSFSRSAWIGVVCAVTTLIWMGIQNPRLKKKLAWALGALVIVGLGVGLALRNNSSFENFIFHTDNNSKIAISSNQGHSSAEKQALKDIAHHPLGTGVGTAGPQSVYNHGNARIAENYYLQIGQETGVIGMVIFLLIGWYMAVQLYLRRSHPLAIALLASFIGLFVVNLLAHAWADDTLAYVWWGLAGICIGTDILKANTHARIPKTT